MSQYFRPRAVEKAQGGLTGEILINYECESSSKAVEKKREKMKRRE
jgi:hypothetical protein